MPAWAQYLLSGVIAFGTVTGVAMQPAEPGKPAAEPTVAILAGAVAAANAISNLNVRKPKRREK